VEYGSLLAYCHMLSRLKTFQTRNSHSNYATTCLNAKVSGQSRASLLLLTPPAILGAIQVANSKFASMSNLLQNSSIHLATRIKFLNSFVRSRLTYSSQNWNLTKAQFERLDVTYRKLIRRMVKGGFKRCDASEGDFRYKIDNAKLHAICHTSDVSNFVRQQQKNYAGHVIRMPVERCAKQLMFNDDKYRKVGRPTPTLLARITTALLIFLLITALN